MRTISTAEFRQYLINLKEEAHPSAPATSEEYADWWEEAVKSHIREIAASKTPFEMRFKPFQKDGPLLVLDKEGQLPEKYQKRFEAYPSYGLEMGIIVEIDELEEGEDKIYRIYAEKETEIE